MHSPDPGITLVIDLFRFFLSCKHFFRISNKRDSNGINEFREIHPEFTSKKFSEMLDLYAFCKCFL